MSSHWIRFSWVLAAAAASWAADPHYSPLKQINRGNVARLRETWRFDTGDAFRDSEMQCRPVIAGGVLYATTPKLRVIALDAASGRPRWTFDPNPTGGVPGKQRNRGLTYWEQGQDRRVFFVYRHWLYALNADTGRPIPGFGNEGRVDLREGLGRDPHEQYLTVTSPGVIYHDLLILGSLVSEDLPASPGDIRAFDVRSGKARWSFHTIPHPGEYGYDTWPRDAWKYSGGANNWPGMSVDEQRGIVFASTGSAAFDFYGANRIGDDLFANSVLALKADTGERLWHFQGVHHDVWDRDFPSAPALVTVERGGQPVDAVAQTTKSGFVYLFDRVTGKPLFPIENRPVPASDVEGEKLSTVQPLPLAPPPFARQQFTEDLVTDRTPEAHRAVLERLRQYRNGGQFTPPTLRGTVLFPGFDGGAEWGGPAFDPETGLLYVNANEMAWILRLVPRPIPAASTGRGLYLRHCAGCHRADLHGTPPEFPALTGIQEKYTREQIASVIRNGNGRMPAFTTLRTNAVEAIIDYVETGRDTAPVPAPVSEIPGMQYRLDGYNKFLDPDGYPAVKPPWGTLTAIDLNSGKFAWRIPFGEYPQLAARGMRHTGSENYGGAVVTGGGLLFIGATNFDRKFRAFDKATGKLLWETTLPAAGNATPAVYEVNGREYVVIGAGGGKSGAPSGGSYVAFSLPEQ